MIIGMFFYRIMMKNLDIVDGLEFVAKNVLKFLIILMGSTFIFFKYFMLVNIQLLLRFSYW